MNSRGSYLEIGASRPQGLATTTCLLVLGAAAILATTTLGIQQQYAANPVATGASVKPALFAPVVQSHHGSQQATTSAQVSSMKGSEQIFSSQPAQAGKMNVGYTPVLGLGCVLAGAAAIVYHLLLRQAKGCSNSWEDAELAMATWTSDKETQQTAENQGKRIAGIKPRPAGYRHDVTRGYQLEEVSRPRRNRRHPAIRSFMRETQMSPANFIMPLFIHDEDYDTPINAMPGCNRLCAASVLREIGECVEQGVNMFILFPKVSDELKTPDGRQCYDPTDIVMRTLKLIKGAYPDVIVCTDIALDPYNTDGHDGIVDEYTGVIMNDITVEQLCKQAVAQARAGTDIVAPSDMQDGRIGAIRDALDSEGFTHVGIMSYCAKYASAFYGPFREALDSNPSFGDKATYQMDPANRRESLREIELDEAEGADILMVKPAMPYLDVILTLKENSNLPIAAYQVSGEYSMIKAGAQAGFIDEQKVALESLLSIRRAGADVILTYFAKDAAKWMNDPTGWWQKKMTGRI